MKKVILVVMPDSSQWQVPIETIAEDRAMYYAEDIKEKRDYDEVYKETMDDMDILVNWGENNVDWSNIKRCATMVKAPDVDYEEGWCNGYKRIVEVE